jgi:putative ABC transport system substrate-binding protein
MAIGIGRREFIAALGGVAVSWPFGARAAASRSRIGVLVLSSKEWAAPYITALQDGLQGLGYIEGQNVVIDERYADGDVEQLPALVQELLQLKPDIIVADAPSAVYAMNKVAPSLPIVCPTFSDAMIPSVAANYAHPGGKVTGLSISVEGVVGKLVEFILDAIPGITKIGFLSNPAGASMALFERQVESSAQPRGAQVVVAQAAKSDALAVAFEQLSAANAQAVIVPPNALFQAQRKQIVGAELASRLPVICTDRLWAEAGGLLSYGVNQTDNWRGAALYLDKILKSASPGDLPIEFATKIELVINLKTAKALGLTIPSTVLSRADDVIE